MDSDNVGAAKDRGGYRGGCRPIAFVGRQWTGGCGQKRFSRRSDENRQAKLSQSIEADERGQALRRALRETQPRIDDHLLEANAKAMRMTDAALEVADHLADNVLVVGVR